MNTARTKTIDRINSADPTLMATQTRNVAGLLPGRVSDLRSRITSTETFADLIRRLEWKWIVRSTLISAYAREISSPFRDTNSPVRSNNYLS